MDRRNGSQLEHRSGPDPAPKYSPGVRTVVGCHPTLYDLRKHPYHQLGGNRSHLNLISHASCNSSGTHVNELFCAWWRVAANFLPTSSQQGRWIHTYKFGMSRRGAVRQPLCRVISKSGRVTPYSSTSLVAPLSDGGSTYKINFTPGVVVIGVVTESAASTLLCEALLPRSRIPSMPNGYRPVFNDPKDRCGVAR